jgi:hypothetical protein
MRRVIFILVIALLLIPSNLGLAQLENLGPSELSESTSTRLVVFEAFMRPT